MDDFTRVLAPLWFFGLSPFLLLGLAIPYVVLRLRDQQGVEHDPQIGLKAALYYFYSLSVILLETGLTIIAIDVMTETQPLRTGAGWNATQQTGAALIVAGLLGSGSHFLMIKGLTNDARWPAARRLFVGWRFAINGLVVMAAFTALIVLLFQQSAGPGSSDSVKMLIATLLIWLPCWGIHLILLHLYRDQPAQPPRLPDADEGEAPPLTEG